MGSVARASGDASEPRSCVRRADPDILFGGASAAGEWRGSACALRATAAARIGQSVRQQCCCDSCGKGGACAVRLIRSMTCVLIVHDVRYLPSRVML